MIPQRAPNFNSPDPDSAWWLYYAGQDQSASNSLVMATTGFFFVRQLQGILSRHSFRVRKAYRSGGPLGGVSVAGIGISGANTDFGAVQIDGKWGSTTNAALWRLIAEQASTSIGSSVPSASSFDPATLRYLDAIEQSSKDRRISPLAIEAAAWLITNAEELGWRSQMLPWPRVAFPEEVRNAVVAPAWNTSPPQPTSPVTGLTLRSWLSSDPSIPGLPTTDRTPAVQPRVTKPSVIVPVIAGVGTIALLGGIFYAAYKSGNKSDEPSDDISLPPPREDQIPYAPRVPARQPPQARRTQVPPRRSR
jgi:hypothetical protein